MDSPKSADHADGRTCQRGGDADRRSSGERFDTFGGYMAGSDASSLHDYFDYQARV